MQRTVVGNLFCEGHLYSEIANDGTKNPALEDYFSVLEGRIDAIIEKAVTAARQDKHPSFTQAERTLWDYFFILQYKRVPDVHHRVGSLREADAELDRIFAHVLERYPEKRAEVEALSSPSARKLLIHNSKVAALQRPSVALEQALARRGIAVLRIARPAKSFIIGSYPIVRFTHPGRTHILDPSVEVWLPIAHDVAIGVGLQAGTESFLAVTEPSWIRHINEGIARQSTMYAGRSKELLCSLSGQPYKGRD